ncbi:MAG: S8 family serine peptidase [Chloroflexota bacterium]|nr:S8 family serine peptidase [Chloroflexota bacterium]
MLKKNYHSTLLLLTIGLAWLLGFSFWQTTTCRGAPALENHPAADAPRLQYTAEPLAVTVIAGEKATRTIFLENIGTRELAYSLTELPPTSTTSAATHVSVQSASGPMQLEPAVGAALATSGSGGYLIYLRQRPDLSLAPQLEWKERGRFVVNALQETAKSSQESVRAYLDRQGASYQAFWIDNVIAVENSTYAAFWGLTASPDIWAIRARRTPILYEPQIAAPPTLTLASIASNLTHVQADRVWNELNITGAGMTVANIDTGVRYTHQALVRQYRGNTGSGFEHNHNWWDPYAGESAPHDEHGHGSHTMGTMLGDDGGANQVGIAPGAKWIACAGFDSSGNSTDAGLLECAQFMVAPWDLSHEQPNPDLRPIVVNNSWGDCDRSIDPWYQDVINAWQAAGIYPVFSNGNASNCGYSSPPGLNTVGNPARYGNVSGIGSTGTNNGKYATHSNWGPTDDRDTVNPRGYAYLKPQVLAPGVAVRSAYKYSDSAYVRMTGTSMSSPHVAGLVALLWEAAPCLLGDYAGTETLIEQTATPLPYATGQGDEGPSNVPNYATGWGEINAYAAVQAGIEYCQNNVAWLATVPITGTIAPTSSAQISVLFDSRQLAAGIYTATLRLNHNDASRNPVLFPVTLTVTDYLSVTLGPTQTIQSGTAESTVTHTLALTNTGDVTATFHLTASGNSWPTTVQPLTVTLAAQATAPITATVQIPDRYALQQSASDTATLTVTVEDDAGLGEHAILTTHGVAEWKYYFPWVEVDRIPTLKGVSTPVHNHPRG